MGSDVSGDRARRVSAETLNVAPAFIGRPLASAGRRIAAMALDLALIGLASSWLNAWFVSAAGLLGWQAWRRRRGAAAGAPKLVAAALAVLLVLGVVDAWRSRVERPSREDDASAEEAGELAREIATQVSAALKTHGVAAAASGVTAAPASAASAASAMEPATPPAEVAGRIATEALARRVAALEAENARLRGTPPDWRERAARWLDALGLGYGGALLYFTLLPLLWPGQTPGKRLLKLRVVQLSGAPMTAGVSFRRFGGYAAGLATGGVGFAQALWDPNAQAIQDKAAHTLVLDER